MRVVRYWDTAANVARYGVIEGDAVREIEGHPYGEIKPTHAKRPLDGLRLMAPCEPTKIVAGGLNYHGHAKEIGLPISKVPVFFLKPPSSLIGHEEPIQYPPETQRLEYEGELAVVVRHPMRNTPPRDVLRCLLGYTCLNDVTARDIQVQGGNLLHLCHSKSFDTFCPTGPWVVTDLDPRGLDLRVLLNGEVRQKTNTSDMIFPVEEMVSYFSQVMTLLPGDLICTGSPAGIGPMQVGDIVEVTIEGIGTLRNRIVRKP